MSKEGEGAKAVGPAGSPPALRGLRPAGLARSPPGSPQTLGCVLCVCLCEREVVDKWGGDSAQIHQDE